MTTATLDPPATTEAEAADMAAREAVGVVQASETASPFDPSRYVVKHGVALIDEHQPGPDRDGNERPYIGYDELKAVADEGNFRIDDTGDYAAINIGHTTDDDRTPQLPAIGFAGPFRLKKIGNKAPRWAIVADNFAIKKEFAGEADKYPRRSVELWFSKQTGKPVMMDPIALLGATTPERALGLQLSARTAGRTDLVCERYEMKNYAAGGNEEITEVDAVTARVLQAIEHTDWCKYIRDLQKRDAAEVAKAMAEGSGELGEADDLDETDNQAGDESPADNVEGDMPTDPKQAKDATDSQDTTPDGGGDATKGKAEPKEKENYAKAAQERDEYRDKYQKEKREREELAETVKSLNERLTKIEGEKRTVERFNKLRDMVDRGYILDLDEESKEIADMSDAECERYMKSLERNARRVPVGHTIHDNLEVERHAKSGDAERDKKRAEVRRLCETKGIDYKSACAEVGYSPSV